MKKAALVFALMLMGLLIVNPVRSAKTQQDPPRWDCCFHIYSTGSNLGWASSLLNYTYIRTRLEPADQTIFDNLLRAGQHVEAACKTCSRMNPAWPDWANKQGFLATQVNSIRQRPDTIIRRQVASNVGATYLWGQPLRVRILGEQAYEHDTCAEKYFRLGFLLGYAQQTFAIAEEIQRTGRNDYAAVVGDARQHLSESLRVLNEYFNVAGCTDVRDLDLQARITNLMNANPAQLPLINTGMRAVWESLQQRLQQRCETATGPTPTPPGGGTLAGVWRGNDPQSPTIRFELINGEYRGTIVELGYLARLHYTLGDQVFTLRQEGNTNAFPGQEKDATVAGGFFWHPVTLTFTPPDTFNVANFTGGVQNNPWRRLFSGPQPPGNRIRFFSNPNPIVRANPVSGGTEIVLRMELTGLGGYGAADGRADILYNGEVGTWNITLPPNVAGARVQSAFFRVSLIADDHYNADLAQYNLAVWVNGNALGSSTANLPHGSPYGGRFVNWTQRDYSIALAAPPYSISFSNTSSLSNWFGVDWIELHLLTR